MSDDQISEGGESNAAIAKITPHQDAWTSLKDSHDPRVFSEAWLEIQSRIIGAEARCGVVVFGVPDQGPFEPVAVWPGGVLGSPILAEAIESAINKRVPVIKDSKRISTSRTPHSHVIACPLLVDAEICGAVAFEVEHLPEAKLNAIQEQLEWGVGWLEVGVHRNKYTSADRLVTVLNLIATSLHHDRFQESATAVVTELAGLLGCERVTIGFLKGKHSQARALSHSATFGKKGNLIRAIEATMDEAVDQHATVVYPAPAEAALQVTRAHAELSKQQGDGAICTVPLTEGERLLGAIVLERPAGEPFDERTIRLCEHTASLLGPLLDVKRKDDRWLLAKAVDSGGSLLKKLFGPRHVGLKLGVLTVVALALFFTYAEGDFRVTADARLEGTVQRAIAVPTAGYLVDSDVRAGDIVKQGDLLFSLDDRDLRLERLKWASQKLQSKREHSEAVAKHDRAKARILSAQMEQADAEIALLDEELKRTRVTAPFDSFIVAGDLSQSLGSPVERGDVMFELAPLDSYRIILKVDERDIDDVLVDQTGLLALTSAPEDSMPITVEKITPLATAEEGRNYFSVEARLDGAITPLLRPGMEGVGKIDVDQRKLIWIWTHKIVHWFRMFFWTWWP
jgi:multidrug resistance efflux pump